MHFCMTEDMHVRWTDRLTILANEFWHPATANDKRKPFDPDTVVDIYDNELKARDLISACSTTVE